MQPTLSDTAPEPTGDRGVPRRAKLLAVVVFLAVIGAVIGAIEFVSPGTGFRWRELWAVPVAAVYWPLALRVMRRTYGARRVEIDRRADATKQAKYWRWFLRYFMPVMALLFAFLGGIDAGPAWQAWHGEGRPGWAVAEHEECDKTCSWTGSFRSDDGTVTRSDVWIWDPPSGARVGDRLRAVDTDDRAAVFDASGDGARTQWWLAMAFFVLGALYLFWWLGWITNIWRALFHDGEDLVPSATS